MLISETLRTSRRDEMIDITRAVSAVIARAGVVNGLAVVYCPHTTAGITIQENADPDVKHDILMRLDEVYPWNHPKYRHAEGNTASHLKALTTGSSQTIIIRDGRPLLGRWQDIYFCEFDGPRHREYYIQLMTTSDSD
ncbi:YjbQ family protein [Paenibacillaceae bacterium]|nr:YjbQ family protein [Paenibacillaceae bacterium]